MAVLTTVHNTTALIMVCLFNKALGVMLYAVVDDTFPVVDEPTGQIVINNNVSVVNNWVKRRQWLGKGSSVVG